MWKKKVKHKKLQMFLVGLVLFATTALFTMCVAFTLEMSDFSQRGITQENCPDTYVFDTGSDDLMESIQNEEIRNNIKSITSVKGRTISVPIMHNGNDITLYYDSLLDASMVGKFGFIKPDDTAQKLPEKGEVWLSRTVSDPNDIEIGDSIILQYEPKMELKVTGFFISTAQPKSMPTTPILGNISDINALADSEPAALHAVTLKNYSEQSCEAVSSHDPYVKIALSRNDARTSVIDVSGTMGGFGSMAGIIVFIVALVIIRFIISTNMIKEYRAIGIYKSLGYTSSEIKSFYVKGYMITGIIAVTLGAVSSLLLVYPLGKICTVYVPGFSITKVSIIVCICLTAVLMALLYINVMLALKKVRKITPVEAIAIGVTSSEKKIKRSVIRSAGSSASMAVNEIFKYKRSTVMSILVLTVSMYLSMLFLMCYTSSSDMGQKGNLWFAMPKQDVYISGKITDEVREYMKDNEHVKSCIFSECLYSPESVKIDGKGSEDIDNINIREVGFVTFSVFDSMDSEVTGVRILKGEASEHEGEICVGTSLAGFLGKKQGDYLKVEVNGTEKEYLITGLYQSMMNGGYGIMMFENDMLDCDPEFKMTRGYVCLNNTNNFQAFKTDIETRFSGLSVDDRWIAVENTVSSIERMLVSVSLILIAVFLVFAVLNTIIVILMAHSNWRKKYGIMKALGFTTGYLVRQNLWKYLIISGVSVTLATLIHKVFSRKLVTVMVIDAFSDDAVLLPALIAGFMVLIMGIAGIISMSLKKITPVELMEE